MGAALAAICQKGVKVEKIRAGRDKPGLRPQHVKGLELVAELCNGKLEGATVDSEDISLIPKKLVCRDAEADTKTAGSCTLLAQVAVPCAVMAGPGEDGSLRSSMKLRGGTDAKNAPLAAYLQQVFLPTLRFRLRLCVDLHVERRGFYPKGGGRVHLKVTAIKPGSFIQPLQMTRKGEINMINVVSFTAGRIPMSTSEDMNEAVEAVLLKAGLEEGKMHFGNVRYSPEKALGDGGGCLIRVTTTEGCILGASAVLTRGTDPKAAAEEAAQQIVDELAHDGCVDRWMQDQLVIFMALARGRSEVTCGEPTLHTRTAISVAEAMTPARFEVKAPEEGGRTWLITCEGAGIPAANPHD